MQSGTNVVMSQPVTVGTTAYGASPVLVPSGWQAQPNAGGSFAPLLAAPATEALGINPAACPTYVVDFGGDGRGQLFGMMAHQEVTPLVDSNGTDPDNPDVFNPAAYVNCDKTVTYSQIGSVDAGYGYDRQDADS